jgi:class 3 adenylate cyclase
MGEGMKPDYPHKLLGNAEELAEYLGWTEEVYQDLLGLQSGRLGEAEFFKKYRWRKAIMVLDMTGFTSTAIRVGELQSLLRILDAQKVCIPVLHEHNAGLIRCFADDIVALFDDPAMALDAAFEIQRRVRLFNESHHAYDYATECCIGIGYGDVLAIGPNLSQGDEMNRAAKLGEDIARANEVLLTERTYEAVIPRDGVKFEKQGQDDQLFPFYQARILD